MAKRVSKHWNYNPRVNITEFNKETLSRDNVVNQMLVLTQQDISSSLVMEMFGSFGGQTMVNHYDTFEVPKGAYKFENEKGKLVSNTNSFITTFGIWIFNIFFIQGFGFAKIFGGYINENINTDIFEDLHQQLLYAMLEDRIDVENYKKFIQYCDFIMPWESFLSPSHTEAILACTKEINKMKAKLIKEHKEELEKGNAVVAEQIEKQILDYVTDTLLKDDPALDPYLSGAGGSLGNNFKNMFIMKGAIRNTDPQAEQEFTISTSSFIDGFSTEDYATLAKSLSGGPYSRAKKTEIGGYWEKLVEAALNTVVIDKEGSECGSDRYIETTLTKKNARMFMYSYMIKSNGKLEELTQENLNKYLGKKIKFRSTLFCKNTDGSVCNCCAGNFFTRRGTKNIGLACASIPTVLKLKSMKKMHDSTVKTVEIDPIRAFLQF